MYRSNFYKQTGFLLPVALFLVVGIAALAIGISRFSSQSNSSVFREGIAIQAFYAAESGLQWAMNQVLFPDTQRSIADASCAGLANADPNQSEIQFNVIGLQGCEVDLSCSSTTNTSNTISYYTIQSASTCAGGEFLSERILQASAYIRE